jgi:RNA polymerase sigma-70 factor (ECF subfamily)
MLGSSADADDALQETLIRAWKHLPSFEGRATLRSWLYSIATKASLDALSHRTARTLSGFDGSTPSDGRGPPAEPLADTHWIEPLADSRWATDDRVGDEARESPESQCTLRQSVALAFLATIQLLPPSQRAALLLHEVAGWSAAEIASALDQSAASVNSALQRARKTLDERIPAWRGRSGDKASGAAMGPHSDATALSADELLRTYVRAWESGDPKALASVLCSDAVMHMPPVPTWFASSEAIVSFFAGFILSLPTKFRASAPLWVNGERAVAIYALMPDGRYVADSLHVCSTRLEKHGEPTRLIHEVAVFRSMVAVTNCGIAPTLA